MSSIEGTGMSNIQRAAPKDFFSRIDSDRSGGVSQAELQKLSNAVADKTNKNIDAGNEAFKSYDSDGNGSLSGEELRAVLDNSGFGPAQGMQGMAPPLPLPQQATDSYNANLPVSEKDVFSDLVSKLKAFLDVLTGNFDQTAQGPSGSPPKDIFGKVDTDRNGSLSKAELEALAENIKKTTGRTLDVSDEAIKAADKNGDGELSPDEVDLRRILSLKSPDLNKDTSAKDLKTALDQTWIQEQQPLNGELQGQSLRNFEQKKAQILRHLDQKIAHVQEEKACVQSAANHDAMKACRERFKAEMKADRPVKK